MLCSSLLNSLQRTLVKKHLWGCWRGCHSEAQQTLMTISLLELGELILKPLLYTDSGDNKSN